MPKIIITATLILFSMNVFALSDQEERCKMYYEVSEPTIARIAKGLTPAPSVQVEKAQRHLKVARNLAQQGQFCAAYQEFLEKS